MVEGRHVRRIPVLMLLILLLPHMANSQSLELFGSAGPTITDPGNRPDGWRRLFTSAANRAGLQLRANPPLEPERL
jgi:hypothetical protein